MPRRWVTALNESLTPEQLPSCENNCHSCLHWSKLQHSVLYETQRMLLIVKWLQAIPLACWKWLDLLDAYFHPPFHCLNASHHQRDFSQSPLISHLGSGAHNMFLCFSIMISRWVGLLAPSAFINFTDVAATSMITCVPVITKTIYYECSDNYGKDYSEINEHLHFQLKRIVMLLFASLQPKSNHINNKDTYRKQTWILQYMRC